MKNEFARIHRYGKNESFLQAPGIDMVSSDNVLSEGCVMRVMMAVMMMTVSASAADWPQWMGPNRDGLWTEPGILTKLPDGGPKKLWQQPIEGGYSGPAVAAGRLVVLDYVRKQGDPKPDPGRKNELDGQERVLAFDAATGKPLWQHSYNCPYHVSYPAGPRCTPTIDGDRVYTLGTMGHLHCLDAKTGDVIWKKDFITDYNAKMPIWGFTGHPLIYKDMLICTVGGPESLLIAFDKATGSVKWKAIATPETDGPGYCPPSIVEAGGTTQCVVWHPTAIVSVNPDTGKEYWKESLKPSYGMSIMMPRTENGWLYAGGIGNAAIAMRLDDKAPKAEAMWRGSKHSAVYPANSTPLIEQGVIYGVDVSGHLRAVDMATGQRHWESTDATVDAPQQPVPHGTAFLVRNTANGHYYLFNEKGSLIIAKLSAEKYTEIDRAKLLEPTTPAFNRTVVWSHPAFANHCIFVRNDTTLACFEMK
jgi:outer membrane protein assembly factor BamB